jgi:membrane fusion protein (multidrug efflux system)
MKHAVPVILFCLLASAAQNTAMAQTPEAPKVSVAAAYIEAISDETAFIGRGEAVDKVDLVARVPGFLRAIAVEDGAEVAAGDLLFSIETDQYEAILASRRADLTRAEAALDLTRIELSRREQLVERGSVPQSELDIARANELTAEADLAAAEAAIRQAELDLGYATITAPFDGRIGRVQRSVGDLVGPTTGALATLVRINPIFVSFSISERQVADLMENEHISRTGAGSDALEVQVRLPNGTVLDEVGRIGFGDNRIDPATGTLIVRAVFDNSEGMILDGAFVTVTIAAPEPVDRLLVPQAALQRDQRGDFVLVVGSESTVEQRYIETGATVGTAIIVTEGLQPGESVIIEGLQRVRPGVPVQAIVSGTEG